MLVVIPLMVVLVCQVFLGMLLIVPFAPTRRMGMAISGLIKSSYGSVMAKTLTGCLVVLLASSLFGAYRVQIRMDKNSVFNGSNGALVDQVELLGDALEASLIAYTLLLGLILPRLHDAMKTGDSLKMNLEFLKKQAKGMEMEYLRLTKERTGEVTDGEDPQLEREKAQQATVAELRSSVEAVKDELEAKSKEVKAAEANVAALKKQATGLQIEYDRLLDDNENLRAQLAQFDRSYARSDEKKRS